MAKKDGDGSGEGEDGRTGDYPIGYGKPPPGTRWKPGQSGNPRGPKKGSRGLKKDLHKALNAKHSIKVNGKVITGTTQELAMYTLATRAAAGDIRAIRQMAELIMQIFGPEDRGRERATISPLDRELLARLLGRAGSDGEGEDEPGERSDPGEGPHDEGKGESDSDGDEDRDEGNGDEA